MQFSTVALALAFAAPSLGAPFGPGPETLIAPETNFTVIVSTSGGLGPVVPPPFGTPLSSPLPTPVPATGYPIQRRHVVDPKPRAKRSLFGFLAFIRALIGQAEQSAEAQDAQLPAGPSTEGFQPGGPMFPAAPTPVAPTQALIPTPQPVVPTPQPVVPTPQPVRSPEGLVVPTPQLIA